MKKVLKIIIITIVVIAGLTITWLTVQSYRAQQAQRRATAALNQQLDDIIAQRQAEQQNGEDLFADSDVVRILLIGLDARIDQVGGNCDAIQLIEINQAQQTVTITAVPRGTYSPLPPGPHQETDYYLANACRIGGIDYGIKQIERVLGRSADHLVFVGFSEAIGLIRLAELPTTETLQWLRHRQGYGIGEPQRAHNHSTFIKQMLIRFSPQLDSAANVPLQYAARSIVRSDLTFGQIRQLAAVVADFDLEERPENILVRMQPWYAVRDITYDAESIDTYLDSQLNPLMAYLPAGSYVDQTKEGIQQQVQAMLEQHHDDPEFIAAAFTQKIWLQLEQEDQRLQWHYDLLIAYLEQQETAEQRQQLIADYILTMESLEQSDWVERGRALLAVEG